MAPFRPALRPQEGLTIENELQQWITKLTRIWKPLSPIEEPVSSPWQTRHIQFKCAGPKNFEVEIKFGLEGLSPDNIFLDGEDCQLEYDKNQHPYVRRHYVPPGKFFPNNWGEILEQFAGRYMALFRRNCWLSGCNLECTAHEQIEWSAWLQEQE